ncbi:MAG: hypothetical protein LUQ66_03205 [Methanoregula sp.]|nr:hypothetical protein [Methanoregula sp.]
MAGKILITTGKTGVILFRALIPMIFPVDAFFAKTGKRYIRSHTMLGCPDGILKDHGFMRM